MSIKQTADHNSLYKARTRVDAYTLKAQLIAT